MLFLKGHLQWGEGRFDCTGNQFCINVSRKGIRAE